ncbi:MAG: PilC/PilY family type IV pilus protein, partial [Arenimonas sp.]
IDDLWHAAVNGHGDFVAATDSAAFTNGLRDALAAIVAKTGSNSNVSANSFSLNSNTRIYLASYVSGQWTGELKAFPITSAGVGSTAAWASASLIPAAASRNILTWNGTGGATFPTAAQTTALTLPVANYIRGVRTNEQQNNPPGTTGVFRDRISILGDIINSSPAYVQDTDTIYVGANDGMLHAFNAVNGVEQFAYIPGGLNLPDLKSLSYITAPAYDHRFFVDGPIVVSTRVQTPSNNYLVGALGRGGKGVFGLNVTTPASFDYSKVMWEQAGDADMGQVISRPVIVKLNDGNTGVLVSNGLNSVNDGAALFILNITTGAVIKKIVPAAATGNNGLSAPRGWDADGNGTVDYVYAGDLLGNVWKFDLTSATASSWAVANSGAAMFVAKDSLGNRQPISGGMSVALEPTTFETWVFFGTGRYLESGDPASLAIQTWYGLIDAGTVIPNRTVLKQRKIVVAGTVSGKLVRGFETAVAGDMAGMRGWYIDLLTPPNPPGTAVGERMIGDPFVSSGTLFASSIIPSSDPCASGGTGFVNAVDAFTGSSGFAGAESPFDLNGNGNFSDDSLTYGAGTIPVGSVDLGIYMPSNPSVISDILVAGGSLGTTATVRVNNPSNSGRISWREIIGD